MGKIALCTVYTTTQTLCFLCTNNNGMFKAVDISGKRPSSLQKQKHFGHFLMSSFSGLERVCYALRELSLSPSPMEYLLQELESWMERPPL